KASKAIGKCTTRGWTGFMGSSFSWPRPRRGSRHPILSTRPRLPEGERTEGPMRPRPVRLTLVTSTCCVKGADDTTHESQVMTPGKRDFIPALTYDVLTPLYDVAIRLTLPELRFKRRLLAVAGIRA